VGTGRLGKEVLAGIGVGYEKIGSGSTKPAISPKRLKTGRRLLLIINMNSHTGFRLVPKSTTLVDPEMTLNDNNFMRSGTLHTCLSEPTTKICMKIDLYYRRETIAECS